MEISKKYTKQDGSYLRVFDMSTIPFEVKRTFFVSSENNELCERGAHAHYKCKQVLTCINGKIRIKYENKDGTRTKTLNSGDSFYHNKVEWLDLTFIKKNSMLLSFCSEDYNEDDYIRDYATFKKVLRGT
jgi:hypothetical protein